MKHVVCQADLTDLVVQYLSGVSESSAHRIAQDLCLSRTEVNSVLYSNPARFQSEGNHPPLWSLKSLEFRNEDEDSKIKDSRSQSQQFNGPEAADGRIVVPDAFLGFRQSDAVPHSHPVDSARPVTTSVSESPIEGPPEMEEILELSGNTPDVEMIMEVEDVVTHFPGLTTSEIGTLLELSSEEVARGIRRVRYLVLTDEEQDDKLSESETGMLASVTQAATMAFPLSTDAYDDLVRRGFVIGRSAVRIIQVFGSWRRACELAGVEAPPPMREHYEHRWTDRELAEAVARFLSDPKYHGGIHGYNEWRDKNMKVDEIPSSGTLKNDLGRSWRTVQNRGLEVLREKWLLDSELEANE